MVGIGHPKQVHFWTNIINNLTNNGHEIKIVAWDKDKTIELLNAYGFKYEIIGKNYIGLIKKAYGMFASELKLLKIANKFKPDLLVAGAPYLAHVSRLIGKPHISFTDTEHASLANCLSFPFSNVIFTPSCYREKIDPKKHVKFEGYMELAYLHPNYFKPDQSVLKDMSLDKEDKFIIVRLVSWDASHDRQSKGFTIDFIEKSIKSLEKYGRVYITSEKKLNSTLNKYKIPFPPEKLHSALYYASLYFGEGGATATEAALLGTPSVHFEAFLTKSGEVTDVIQGQHIGVRDELVNKYGIAYTFGNQDQALIKAEEILQEENIKEQMKEKLKQLLNDKVDVTDLISNFIENYPESFLKYKSTEY